MAELFQQNRAPPFTEWKPDWELLEAAPAFQPFVVARKGRGQSKTARDSARLYFYTTDIKQLAKKNAKADKKFSMRLGYGASPDEPANLTVEAEGCPKTIARAVPVDHELCKAIFDTAVARLRLDGTRQLIYRGESLTAVTERLRIELSRPTRGTWSQDNRCEILNRQGGRCRNCESTVQLATAHLDHIVALSHGGADELKNLQILCIGCHGEKSETERLGGIYRKSLYSELSRDVLELFKSAPKPRQLVYGDGTNNCVQIDVVLSLIHI